MAKGGALSPAANNPILAKDLTRCKAALDRLRRTHPEHVNTIKRLYPNAGARANSDHNWIVADAIALMFRKSGAGEKFNRDLVRSCFMEVRRLDSHRVMLSLSGESVTEAKPLPPIKSPPRTIAIAQAPLMLPAPRVAGLLPAPDPRRYGVMVADVSLPHLGNNTPATHTLYVRCLSWNYQVVTDRASGRVIRFRWERTAALHWCAERPLSDRPVRQPDPVVLERGDWKWREYTLTEVMK